MTGARATLHELADTKRQTILKELERLEIKHDFKLVIERGNEPEIELTVQGKSFILSLR